MKMPALLPPIFRHHEASIDDDALFEQLSKSLEDLTQFFIHAADDETWSLNHPVFMKKSLEMLTGSTLENKLDLNKIQKLKKSIHEHHQSLYSYLPFDLRAEIDGKFFQLNSLLLFGASESFRSSIKENNLILKNISLTHFKIIEEFVNTGRVDDLWKLDQIELTSMVMISKNLNLNELQYLCEHVLKRYITRDNILVMLVEAHNKGLQVLKDACIDSFNELRNGVKLYKTDLTFFEFEFLDFKQNALDVFEEVKSLITHLIISGDLTGESEFAKIVNACPLLIQLNIQSSSEFNERLFEISEKLPELSVSSCNWLDGPILSRIVTHFKGLKAIILSDNIQLDHTAFTHLSKLKLLRQLNISRNPQIHDDEFKLILQAVPQIIDLDCSDCKNISDKGFFEIARSLSHLIFLNLERTQISDGLLLEIIVRSNYLEELNISRSHRITDRGILESVKLSKALKVLIIRHCHFSEGTLSEIKELKPSLKVID